ncbi:MAG TPA: exodeoxyribonuclease VII large subunit [Pyrinomonadaceae bacterium]|nr:exodeoxyribonuclease VII large subunit [Pyrinomonadaceae bacterium]
MLSLFDETERRPLTVSELTSQVRGAVENRFASVWVEGEISNFRPHRSGHWYFTVKDESAQLRATCFRGVNCRIRFRPADGLQVRARGRLTVYEPRGEYELVVEGLDPAGAGALRVAFEQLRERLASEGLFDEELKRELPLLPRRVGVVTSPTGAALRDIIRAVERRTRTVHLLVAPVRVQGEGAPGEIARAVELLNAFHARAVAEGRADEGVDAIIVARGGGSAEDLWAFNAEEVARAIRASRVPVITGVGHETDTTIADLAADVRAATPTAAAEVVAAREDEIASYVEGLGRDMVQALRFRLIRERTRVQEAAMSYGFDEARRRLREASDATTDARARLDKVFGRRLEESRRRLEASLRRLSPARTAERAGRARLSLAVARAELERAWASRLEDARARLAVASVSLDALSPLAVLGRGYALAEDGGGRVLRSSRGVERGDGVRVRLGEGALRCRVEEVEES